MFKTLLEKLEAHQKLLPLDPRLTGINIEASVRKDHGNDITNAKITATKSGVTREIIVPFNALPDSAYTIDQAVVIERLWMVLPILIRWAIEHGAYQALSNFIYFNTPEDALPAKQSKEQHLMFLYISCDNTVVA